jgi:hypothetical protein
VIYASLILQAATFSSFKTALNFHFLPFSSSSIVAIASPTLFPFLSKQGIDKRIIFYIPYYIRIYFLSKGLKICYNE